MNSKLVSIIVPVYNVEHYLNRCLKSLTHQTYNNIEIILVDDGSTDNSGRICDDFAKEDSRILVIHKHNEGVAQARLYGFENSKGDYITFLDSDDYVSINYVEKLLEPVYKQNVDLVCCKHYFQHDEKIFPSNFTINGFFNKKRLIRLISSNYLYNDQLGYSSIPVYLWAKLIRRDYVKEGLLAGKGLSYWEDQIALFRILLNINSMYVLDDYLYYYIRYNEQTTFIYKSSLWQNQLNTYLRYKEIDQNNYLGTQLVKNVWKFSFIVNIYKKMPQKIHSKDDFIKEIKSLEIIEGWKEFFKEKRTGLGWRNDIKFWLIKLKLYKLLYMLFLKKVYEK